jgi:tetratricopeptide (TPR) repeat protein
VNKLASGEYKIRLFNTKEISAEELNDLRYAANLDINFINNRNMKKGNYEFAIKLYNDVLAKYPFHVVALGCVEKCYQKLNKMEKTRKVSEKIINLLKSDESAITMFNKFNHLMPELSKYKKFVNTQIPYPLAKYDTPLPCLQK